jgi:hypothetical protein
MRVSSSEEEERSTTGIFSEGLPCSKTGEQWQREQTSDGDPSGGVDPDGTNSGVDALLGDEEPSWEGERGRLVPLLSSIVVKRRRREENPKRQVKECEMAINARQKVYLYPVKHRSATVIGIISIPTRPITRATLKTMHHALVIRTVKQTAQLFRKRYTEM